MRVEGEWPLVGRSAELEWLTGLVGAGAGGVVLAGPARVGKTRLAGECLALAAARGFAPVRVAATAAAATLPFGAYAPLLLRLITTLAFKAGTAAATKVVIEEAKEKLGPKIEEAKEKLALGLIAIFALATNGEDGSYLSDTDPTLPAWVGLGDGRGGRRPGRPRKCRRRQ